MLRLALIFGGRSAEHEISLASARFVCSMLDRDKYEVVPVGITRGRPLGACRDDFDAATADGLDAAAVADRRTSSPTRRARACELADGSFQPARLRLPHHARHLRRGRHHPGPARDGRPGLRRVRRARQLRRHGQGDHEGRVRQPRACRRWTTWCCATPRPPAPDAVAAVEDAPRLPGVRQAGQPRLQRGHDQGPRPRRAGAGARAGRRLRPQGHRRGGLRRPRDRVRRARQRGRRAPRSPARSSRSTSSTTTRPSTPRA